MENKYQEIIAKLQSRADYFYGIDFPRIANDLREAQIAIQELYDILNKIKTPSKEEQKEEVNK